MDSIQTGIQQLNVAELRHFENIKFDKMAENLRAIIGCINSHSTLVADSAKQLKDNAIQSSKTNGQITISIQQVSQGVAEQAAESQRGNGGNYFRYHNGLRSQGHF